MLAEGMDTVILPSKDVPLYTDNRKIPYLTHLKMEETSMEMKMSIEEARDRAKSLMQSGYH